MHKTRSQLIYFIKYNVLRMQNLENPLSENLIILKEMFKEVDNHKIKIITIHIFLHIIYLTYGSSGNFV